MTIGRYFLGLGLTAASLAPLGAGAWALRARLLPRWSGAPARLVEAVIAVCAVVLVAEGLGVAGLLEVVPVVAACALVGLALWRFGRRAGQLQPGAPPPPAPRSGRPARAVAGAAVAVLVAEWCTRLLSALDRGMTSADTVWYHLPQAARFVQDGSTVDVQFFETGAGTAFYPATSGLFHALGMLWLGNDFLSPFLNMGWLALALLAAWCVGRPYGLGPASLVGVAVVLGTPIMVETQPGGAYNDIVGLALFLTAAALLVNGGATGAPGVLAALAAAPALGTKLSLAVPLAALCVGAVAIAPAGRRLLTAGTWLGALLVLGGFWYVRNLFAFGNPIPALDLDIGPISLPSPPLTKLTFSLVHYFGRPGVWGDDFLPGLLEAFGPAWWALLGLAVAGMVGALVAGRTPVERMLGAVAIVSAVAFLFTPQGLGTEDDPLFFKFNLRYPTPGIVLGLALLPLVPWPTRGWRWLPLAACAAVLAVTQLDPAIWPTGLREERFAEPPKSAIALGALGIGAAVLAAAVALATLGGRGVLARAAAWGPRRALGTGVALAAVLVAASWLLQRDYLRDRYTDFTPLRATASWARGIHDSRIAIVGFFVQYPLYGLDLSNIVDYVAERGPHGAFRRIESCPKWRQALNEGRYEYVVTAPFNYPGNLRREPPDEERWTGSDAAARRVLRENDVVSVFRLDGRLDAQGCGRAARAAGARWASGESSPGLVSR